MKKRLFTFGCSFTSYVWPTWADILAKEFDYFQNWGQGGAGNQFIFNSLIECNVRNKLNSDDTVIIMWTNVAREDRYVNGKWLSPGNIYTQEEYNKEFVKKFSDPRGYLIRDLATIYAAIELLEKWKVNYKLLCMVPLENDSQYTFSSSNRDKDVLNLYSSLFDKVFPSVFEIIFNFDYEDHCKNHRNNVPNDIRNDPHPVPSEHLKYIQTVLPEYVISDKTKEWVNEVEKITYLDVMSWRKNQNIKYWVRESNRPPRL